VRTLTAGTVIALSSSSRRSGSSTGASSRLSPPGAEQVREIDLVGGGRIHTF
jgi:hypothetical protein